MHLQKNNQTIRNGFYRVNRGKSHFFLLNIIPHYGKLRQGDKMDIIKTLTEEFSLKPFQVENTVKLIDDGNTIPFIARYRKEATGSLDDQVLRSLYERLTLLLHRDSN